MENSNKCNGKIKLVKEGGHMKTKKIFAILIIQIILIFNIIGISNAAEEDTSATGGDTKTGFSTGSWISPDSYKPEDLQNADTVKDIGNIVIGIIQFVGTCTSVIVVIIMGIKYMTASLEEKAEYKKTMIPYLIGAVLVFATTNILGVVSTIMSQV